MLRDWIDLQPLRKALSEVTAILQKIYVRPLSREREHTISKAVEVLIRIVNEALMTLDELSSKLEDLENTRRRRPASPSWKPSRTAVQLDEDRDALLTCMAGTVPEDLDDLTPEEKNKV